MKKNVLLTVVFSVVILVSMVSFVFCRYQQPGFILEHEKNIAKEEPAPHQGAGISTAYSFFSGVPGLTVAFRKRVLHPGSAIGYHLQKEDEVYYILSGTGIMKINDDSFAVKAGDAILTRPGSSHGLRQTGTDSLAVIINYLIK